MTDQSSQMPFVRPGRRPLLIAGAIPVLVIAMWPYRSIELGSSTAFLPAFLAVIVVLEGITAAVLVSQYLAGGDPRLWALSWAYTWSLLTVVPHALVFPGVVTETGTLWAAPSSAPWLWTAWHVGFVVLLGAALAPWRPSWERPHGVTRRRAGVLAGTAVLAAGAALFTAWVTVWSASAPVVIVDGDYTRLTQLLGGPVLVVTVVALVAAAWGLSRRRDSSGLETWAFIALTAGAADIAITLLARERLTVGWYGARVLAVTAAAVVLHAVLQEVTRLHQRLRSYADTVASQNVDLQHASELRERVVGVVSHELATPLTGLIGYLELLLDDVDESGAVDDQNVRMLTRCASLARRSEIIAEDLLTVATVSSGQTLVCRPEVVDVRGALDEVGSLFHDLDLRSDCEPGLRAVADPTRLQQLLSNLVRNAQKYGAEPVTIRAARLGEDVELVVSDAGPGVPRDFVPRLFDQFSRADGHAALKGTGLGMWIARELAHGMGGTLDYCPDPHRFVVRLPRADVLEDAGPGRPARTSSTPSLEA